ncbi:DNA/RNA nuclease SfsA [Rhizobium halophytocola]|uniref:Sugar fermentation stimulation protein homolog n=1 Tax=Rhizobium halophytocola TaxID=735519 RepID=A0ABS4DW28_9HYPH|nr:DNA/RNA nuclease SfsA [Rhizobium halophytocola]MBP1849899.1 sugar fermentation stimulation protein A [Rhizobium halophytocola]
MIFSPALTPARLVRRYKRFLFDAVLDDGTGITGFCPNTGSMLGLTDPGSRIWMSDHAGSTRKHRYALELVEAQGTVVGVHAALANRLAEEAIRAGLVEDLARYETIRREQRYGRNSRVDFLLSSPGRPDAYVEVKNVHFTRAPGLAEFPDTVTARGAKHLAELGEMVDAGHRAVMLYLIQRGDCERFRLSGDLDPAYVAAYRSAAARGVEAYAVDCRVNAAEITPLRRIGMDEPALAALSTM